MSEVNAKFQSALNDAMDLMRALADLEPRSALKQAAWDNGITEASLEAFVHWAEKALYGK